MFGLFDALFGGGYDEVRVPEFDGLYYPDEEEPLREAVESHLESANPPDGSPPRAIVVPHGEYDYAGPVMASGWACILEAASSYDRIAVMGSSARVPFRGVATSPMDAFETPLGPLGLDVDDIEDLIHIDGMRAIEPAFDPAASVEVQLPFAQAILGDVALVPLLVGDATDEQVAGVLDRLWNESTLLVVSANLSEGHPHDEARELDDETIDAIESGDIEAIERRHTTARLPLRGLVRVARERSWTLTCLDRRTSAETAGRPEEVVGYGAIVAR
jgi:AmmeMemoRadiSam system protein B